MKAQDAMHGLPIAKLGEEVRGTLRLQETNAVGRGLSIAIRDRAIRLGGTLLRVHERHERPEVMIGPEGRAGIEHPEPLRRGVENDMRMLPGDRRPGISSLL